MDKELETDKEARKRAYRLGYTVQPRSEWVGFAPTEMGQIRAFLEMHDLSCQPKPYESGTYNFPE